MNAALVYASTAATLLGQYAGSTSRTGSLLYVVGGAAWIAWMVRTRNWSFIPINVAGSAITAWNVVVAFGIRF